MIDLRSSDDAIATYVRRYENLLPPTSSVLAHKMQDQLMPDNPRPHARDPAPPAWLTPRHTRATPDNAIGAFLGLAIGDALGATLEFSRRDSGHVDDLVGGGPFKLAPGEWTDDTSMALCLADTLLAKSGFDPVDFATRLAGWYKNGENTVRGHCFDIGNTTRTAIEAFLTTGRSQSGPADPASAGNGSVVRLAPLVIFLRHSLARTWTLAQAQSKATHNAAEALSSCQFFAVVLWQAMNGYSKEEVFEPKVLPLQPRPMIINAGEYKTKQRSDIRSSGYVIDTLEAALWSVWTTQNFTEAVKTAANLADDSDSVAALTGQLAGALYGADGIPAEWRRKVAWGDRIATLATELFDSAPQKP